MSSLSGYGDLITGCAASLCNISVTHPLYTIRSCIMAGKPVGRLYHGLTANMVCDQSNVIVYFATFGLIQRKFQEIYGRKMENEERAVAGAVSGCFSGVMLTFLERVMIIQQLRAKPTDHMFRENSNMVQTARELIKLEGVRAVTRGIVPTMGREGINAAGFFGLSKALQPKISSVLFGQREVKSTAEKVAVSGMAFFMGGAISGFVTSPFDLLKTRMQKEVGRQAIGMGDVVKTLAWQLNINPTMKYMLVKAALARSVMIGSSALVMGLVADHLMPCLLPESLASSTT